MIELTPDAVVRAVAPWEFLQVREAAPEPPVVVLDGDASAWERVERGANRSRAVDRLRTAPWLTIGVVRGGNGLFEAGEVVRACDLRAIVGAQPEAQRWCNTSGDSATVDRAVTEWSAAIARAPYACLVGAQVLRSSQPSLLTESLAYSMLQAGPAHRSWLETRARHAGHPAADRARAATDADHGGEVSSAGRRVSVVTHERGRDVVLSRPDKRNALDALMREELCDVLDAIAQEPAVPFVLRGQGPSFCAGGDLDEFGSVRDPAVGHVVRTRRSVAARLRRLQGRFVAAVHGHCVGAGMELAAFASRVVATPDASFQLPEATLGLIPGAGGTVSLPPRIGRHRTLELLVTGRTIDAATAHRWGLVDEVTAPGALLERARTAAASRQERDQR